ncbi:hypothetical protein B0T18DRAFT_100674 [Schizothecium vesticola]|uniref:Uncharacterized protein n=1 Tax=Schizothecium vesticola TaxID=314040 RepID=A0AA40F150_9PEZI|nr:hypothetical protein B0T18DRAFT_100674 [Schizothecium vesticola]
MGRSWMSSMALAAACQRQLLSLAAQAKKCSGRGRVTGQAVGWSLLCWRLPSAPRPAFSRAPLPFSNPQNEMRVHGD